MTTRDDPADTRPVALIGAGGHARVVVSTLRRAGMTLGAVLDTDPGRVGETFAGLAIQPDLGGGGRLHVAIGSNAARRAVVEARPDADWVTLVDPAAHVADDVEMGPGGLICMGAALQSGARLGRHVIVNTGAVVEHDCVVGDFSHIAPGAVLTGGVTVGDGVMVGAGATVLPGLTLADGAVIGAGAVVVRAVGPGETVVGSPARPTGRSDR